MIIQIRKDSEFRKALQDALRNEKTVTMIVGESSYQCKVSREYEDGLFMIKYDVIETEWKG